MATEIHFVDVGQGNMVLIKADDGSRFVFDCNITQDNESRVLGYVAKVFGRSNRIRAFICSHRDADHMRGVTKLHNKNPISEIWDSGYAGTTTGSPEYTQYMNLRCKVGVREIENLHTKILEVPVFDTSVPQITVCRRMQMHKGS